MAMLAAVPAAVASVGAALYYGRGRSKADDEEEADEAEGVLVEAKDAVPPAKTWRQSSGRMDGPDSYVFGDLTRGVVRYARGSSWATAATEAEVKEEKRLEAVADEQYTHVQVLVKEALRLYRARGYNGTINMSQNVAYFTESTSVTVAPPAGGIPPWAAADKFDATAAFASDSRAGRVFATLLSRLERRARSWEAMSGVEGLDPNLTSSAHIGFAVPVIKIGWGVSISLTVSASSLLRWSAYAAAEGAAAAEAEDEAGDEQSVECIAKSVTSNAVQDAIRLAGQQEQ